MASPPRDGKRKKPEFPALNALVLRDPGSCAGLAAQPGEAGVKRRKVSEIRGLQVCQRLVPSVTWAPTHPAGTLLSLGSTVMEAHCLRTPSGRPRQRLTAVGPGALRPARLPTAAPSWRTALSAGLCRSSTCLFPGSWGATAAGGTHGLGGLSSSGVKPPGPRPAPEPWVQCSSPPSLCPLAYTVKAAVVPLQRGTERFQRDPRLQQDGAAPRILCFRSSASPRCGRWVIFIAPSSASDSFPFGLVCGSSKSE